MDLPHSFLPVIGQTPVVKLKRISSELGCDVFAKLEGFNPGGSTKDRPAAYLLTRALEEGHIDRNSLVVESSSGNFGVALATFCGIHGIDLQIPGARRRGGIFSRTRWLEPLSGSRYL